MLNATSVTEDSNVIDELRLNLRIMRERDQLKFKKWKQIIRGKGEENNTIADQKNKRGKDDMNKKKSSSIRHPNRTNLLI